VVVDGDVIRETFGQDQDYTLTGRRRNADRICALGMFLEEQGVDVICAILSIFRESRSWNRAHLQNYFEVYIDSPIEYLRARDSKGIYGKFERGEICDVAGLDLEFPIPESPDMIIHNEGELGDLLKYADSLANRYFGAEG
jgi:adenylylsulfate kinase